LWIATAVEFLMVPPGKVWHTCQIPRSLSEN
jgi:hypothetical protein